MQRLSILVWMFTLSLPLWATTVSKASLDDLIQKSTSIVRGRVASSQAVSKGLLINTQYKIQVVERWKGPAVAQETVQIPGGKLNGREQNVAGAPKLDAGAEYLFFLWTGPSGATHLLGLSQGVLDVTRDAAGNVIAVRQSSAAAVVDPETGAVGPQEPLNLKLDDFKSRVGRTLRKEAR